MEKSVNNGGDLHLEATELRLGLPGSDGHEKQSSASVKNKKRTSTEVMMTEESRSKSNSNVSDARNGNPDGDPPAK